MPLEIISSKLIENRKGAKINNNLTAVVILLGLNEIILLSKVVVAAGSVIVDHVLPLHGDPAVRHVQYGHAAVLVDAAVPEILLIRDGETAEQPLDRRPMAGKKDGLVRIVRVVGHLVQKVRGPPTQLLDALRSLGRDIMAGIDKKIHESGIRDRIMIRTAAISFIDAKTDLP